MAKTCLIEDCENRRFGGGYCLNHQYKRTDKSTFPSFKKSTPIKKQSDKTKRLTAKYLKARLKFLDGKICPITGRPATEIHHIAGREYERLINESEWLAVTREGHNKIHSNPSWAREKGYLK